MKKTLEDLQVEKRAGVQCIAAWAGEASTTLVPLGVSPIPVSELPAFISDALPVLDSAADYLRRLDQILGARLEAEGGSLYQAVIEYILIDVLPEPRPDHLLGAGDCWSGGRPRRHRPGGRSRYCGGGGRALPAGSCR
jgi:hypothetical protein